MVRHQIRAGDLKLFRFTSIEISRCLDRGGGQAAWQARLRPGSRSCHPCPSPPPFSSREQSSLPAATQLRLPPHPLLAVRRAGIPCQARGCLLSPSYVSVYTPCFQFDVPPFCKLRMQLCGLVVASSACTVHTAEPIHQPAPMPCTYRE